MMVLPKLPGMPPVEGAEVDRVVAIVNGELILDSDVDRERRFAALLPYGETAGPYNRDAAIERLINRDLILQQLQLQPGTEVTQEAASRDLDALRKTIPTCKEYHCETQAGWDKFLATEGFTEESLTSLWRQRMDVLAFIELRFRMGIKIEPAEIREYYEKTMLPQYAAQQVTPPPVRRSPAASRRCCCNSRCRSCWMTGWTVCARRAMWWCCIRERRRHERRESGAAARGAGEFGEDAEATPKKRSRGAACLWMELCCRWWGW